jgi:hypothetical protein
VSDDPKVREKIEACFCVGPQNGDPLCPCRMRRVKVKDGRYVEEIDHGEVKVWDKDWEDFYRDWGRS